jgi:ring-1,2-phenylacetyl-CoA epoxidase subunit PaaB
VEVYEIFRRAGHKTPFEHCGAVIAPDPEMALLLGKECFLRRREGEHLWAVRRADIHALEDESLLEIAADKSYRFASDYRDVMSMRQAARIRASGVSS